MATSLPQDAIFIKGDTIDLEFQLFKDKCTNEYWDISNHQIRFQLNTPTKIYKATANVEGGSDDQIAILNASQGKFLISVTHVESAEIAPGDYTYEIQITTPSLESGVEGKKYTILQSTLRILDESITWDEEPDEV